MKGSAANRSEFAIPRVPGAVDIGVLGSLQVLGDSGDPVELPGGKPRALLALLALRAPDAVPNDEIVDAVWGDDPPADPDASLHVTVSRVRKALGDEVVATAPGGYRLDLPVTNSDLERFRLHCRRGRQLATLGHHGRAAESYRHALSQWRGPVLADLRSYDFTERAAMSLEEERLSTVEALIDAEIESGGHDLVVGELAGLVEAFPLRERFWRQFMLALYRSGRQAEALRAYQSLREILGGELGVEPDPDTSALEERILLHDPALAHLAEEPVQRPTDVAFASFSAGDVIVEEGEAADTIYWIESGRVEILRAGDDGRQEVFAELGAGRYFGELASLLGTGRTATIRAAEPTTVSIHDAVGFRGRLGSERTRQEMKEDRIDAIHDSIRRGEYLAAFDSAIAAIDNGSTDSEVRYLAVQAAAKAGSTVQARRLFDQYSLGRVAAESLSPRLAVDIPALAARLDKDMALLGDEDSTEWARRSAEGYGAIFEKTGEPYVGGNAATMWLLAGDTDQAHKVASETLVALEVAPAPTGEGIYWHGVTEAEAALVVGNETRAAEALSRAAGAKADNYAARATTLHQLGIVCDLVGIDREVLGPIRNPGVVHYAGHLILPTGEEGRFPAGLESTVREQLDEAFEELNVGFGFGSLAAGADILAAEALLDRGAELHVVLPFGRDEFVRASVLPAGESWVGRFERCLASARRVVTAVRSEYLDDPTLFEFCGRIAMGDAIRRARHLAAPVKQVVVWDGVETGATAGTSADVAHWRASGRSSRVIGLPPGDPGPAMEPKRKVKAVLFADFAGFSRLTDAEVFRFQEEVMGQLAGVLGEHREDISSARTWGDGLYLVIDDVPAAAQVALALQEAVSEMDFARMGLEGIRGLRVAAHATPVFEGWDPIAEVPLVFGSGVTETARIEPKTPQGEIFVTHPFASLSVLSDDRSFDCQYVGTLPTAKSYGDLPLYSLRRRPGIR